MMRLLLVMGVLLAAALSLPAEDAEFAQDQEGVPEAGALRRRPPWRARPTFHIERTTVQKPEAPLSADIYTSALNTIQQEKLPHQGPVRLLPHSTLLTEYVSEEASAAAEEEEVPAPQGPAPGRSPERRPLPHAPVQDVPLPQRPPANSPPALRPLPQRPLANSPSAQRPLANSPSAQRPLANSPSAQRPLANSPPAQRPLPKRPIPHRPPPSAQSPLPVRPVAVRRPVAIPAGDTEQLAEESFRLSSLFRDRVRRPAARRRRPVQPVRGRARQPNKRPKVRVQALAPRPKPGPKIRRPQLPPPKPYRPALPPSKPVRRPPPPPPPTSPTRPPSPTLPPTTPTTPPTTTQDPLSVHNLAGPPYFDTIPPEVLLMDETVTVPALPSTTSATTTTVPPYISDWRPVSTPRPRLTEPTHSRDIFDGRPPHGQGRDAEKDTHHDLRDPHVGSHWHEGSQRDVDSHRDLSTHHQEGPRKDKDSTRDTQREKGVNESDWNKGIGWEVMEDIDWYNEWTKNWNNNWNIDWSNRWLIDPPLKDTDAPLNTLPTDPPKNIAGTSSPRPTFTPTNPPSTFAPSNPPQRFAPTNVPPRFTPTDQPQTNLPKRNDGFQRHPNEPPRDTRYQGNSHGNRRYHEIPPRSPSNPNAPLGNRNYQETPQRGNPQFSSPGGRVPQEIPKRDTGYKANLPGNREYQETPQRDTIYPSSPLGNRPPKDIPQRITSYQHVSQGIRRYSEPPQRGQRPNPQAPSHVPTRHNGHQGIHPGRIEENTRRVFHRPSQRLQGSSEHPTQTRLRVVGPPRPPPAGTGSGGPLAVSGPAKIRPGYTPRRPQPPGTAPRLPPRVQGSSRLGRPMIHQPAASAPDPAWRPRRRIIKI